MRISDWSSDVCSSDLPAGLTRPTDGARHASASAGLGRLSAFCLAGGLAGGLVAGLLGLRLRGGPRAQPEHLVERAQRCKQVRAYLRVGPPGAGATRALGRPTVGPGRVEQG